MLAHVSASRQFDPAQPQISPSKLRSVTISAALTSLAYAEDPADKIYDLAGGLSRPIRGLKKGEYIVAWGKDPLPLYVAAREGSVVINLLRLDPFTGQRQFWRRLMPSDPAGVRNVADLYIAPDAQAYGYSYYRLLSQLYVAEGIH